MNETTVIEWALIGLAWICGLVALGAVLLLILDYFRDPPRWWVRRQVPDFVPNDWHPTTGIDVIDPTPPHGSDFRPELDAPEGSRRTDQT